MKISLDFQVVTLREAIARGVIYGKDNRITVNRQLTEDYLANYGWVAVHVDPRGWIDDLHKYQTTEGGLIGAVEVKSCTKIDKNLYEWLLGGVVVFYEKYPLSIKHSQLWKIEDLPAEFQRTEILELLSRNLSGVREPG